MESPLLQPVPTPKRRIVPGRHVTSAGNFFNIDRVADNYVAAFFGLPPAPTNLRASCLRELAELFTDLANALDGK